MIQIVYDKIVDFCGMNDIPCVIVGSKIDLQARYVYLLPIVAADPNPLSPHSPISRQVLSEEGEELAKTNKAAWVETSAKNNINVGELPCPFK